MGVVWSRRGSKQGLWIEEIPYTIVDQFRAKRPAVDIQECVAKAGYRLYMRTYEPPFNDVRVRRAAALAIDQDSLLQAVLRGEA